MRVMPVGHIDNQYLMILGRGSNDGREEEFNVS
jgi:hypothetical protein